MYDTDAAGIMGRICRCYYTAAVCSLCCLLGRNSEDTGSKDLGSAWQADTYFQYQAIGTVWSSGGSSDSPTPPNATAYYLVNSNCIQECSFNSSTPPQLVWSTNDYSKKVLRC